MPGRLAAAAALLLLSGCSAQPRTPLTLAVSDDGTTCRQGVDSGRCDIVLGRLKAQLRAGGPYSVTVAVSGSASSRLTGRRIAAELSVLGVEGVALADGGR